MGVTFSVKNFEKFQHYKNRSPPWIKLYNELLDDYAFGALPDASKMHLVAIWLLASRYENKIPYDATWVGRRINATDLVDLDALAKSDFIQINQYGANGKQIASGVLAECLSRERERDRDRVEVERGYPSKDSIKGKEGDWDDFGTEAVPSRDVGCDQEFGEDGN